MKSIKVNDDVLTCPECDGINLHQTSAEIWNRKKEDTDTGLHVTVDGSESFRVDEEMSENPSLRRQGLSITFRCEDCDNMDEDWTDAEVLVLNIIQHKGSTFIGWQDE